MVDVHFLWLWVKIRPFSTFCSKYRYNIVYRHSNKKYCDMSFGPYRPALLSPISSWRARCPEHVICYLHSFLPCMAFLSTPHAAPSAITVKCWANEPSPVLSPPINAEHLYFLYQATSLSLLQVCVFVCVCVSLFVCLSVINGLS